MRVAYIPLMLNTPIMWYAVIYWACFVLGGAGGWLQELYLKEAQATGSIKANKGHGVQKNGCQ